ncbi:protein-disulfide isomerase [Halogeometricum borinquense DSM 11551]|uniref:Protein-disulfide isomerase n=2 Tax=Halogeometricum borinquense TaxID=60847 RepID=E4NNT7_HALBP|nr:thioredoxin domain-containing protein [Halogeometricum borinquense]ADQ67551.1 protein-disulfide isomerase [Halogeometricum borinquense DSM 11551]ELY23769.1 protein-disulfide isomerase [Halogeometricum borinquense DSM 11551]RYJ13484.1 DsbA family protein [Halogeometricum borinquense]
MRTTRRSYLAAAGGALAATAGCLGGSDSQSKPSCEVGDLEQVKSLPTPTLGPEDADVTVDVYEDFACPHCATYNVDVFPKVKQNYIDTGKIRYRFFDFPIPVSKQWSWGGAIAARAVQDRTDDETYFKYAKRLFEKQNELTSNGYTVIHDVANEFDVDGCEVMASVEQDIYRSVVKSDRQRGIEVDIGGTPAIIVNGEHLSGAGWETVKNGIEGHLKSASKS